MTVTLEGLNVPLPKEWAPTLLKEALEQSVIGQVAPSTPIPLDGQTIPVFDSEFEVGVVGEGERKPVSNASLSVRTLTPRKVAGIMVVSKELARRNPGDMVTLMQADMRNAIGRAVTSLILHGRDPLRGTTVSDVTYVNQTTNRVPFDPATDLVPQILAGYEAAASAPGSDPNGFVFDSSLRVALAMASQVVRTPEGVPQPMPNLATASDYVAGLKAAYGRAVTGKTRHADATNVRGFVGDWSTLRWGFSSNITMSRSTEATVTLEDGTTVNLWQNNLIGFLIEAELGWLVMDPQKFAAYETAGGTP